MYLFPAGHAFILVYVNLLIVEEAKAIVGWEGIRDQIRMEDHRRGETTNDPQETKTPLENLTEEDLVILKVCWDCNSLIYLFVYIFIF